MQRRAGLGAIFGRLTGDGQLHSTDRQIDRASVRLTRFDKIDAEGLVKVASVAKEAVEYLAGRTEPLTGPGKALAAATAPTRTERKVSLGTVPDFAYKGNGFRLSGVVAGSPAEAAGMKEGDVIVMINTLPVGGLKEFSDILKTLKPGDRVSIRFLRANAEMKVEAVVKER